MCGGAKPSRATDDPSRSGTVVGSSALKPLLWPRRHGCTAALVLLNDDMGTPTAASEFRLPIPKFLSRAVKFGVENQSYRLGILAVLFSQLGIYL